MNLVQQFPDVSMNMRHKFKSHRKNSLMRDLNLQKNQDQDKVMTKFYKDEFRKWHIKLILIIVFTVASLSIIILNVPWFF